MDDPTYNDRRQRIIQRVTFWMFNTSKEYSISQEDLMGDWPQHLLHNIGVYMQNACPEDLGLGVPQRSTNVIYVAWIANQPWRVYVGSTNSFPSRHYHHMSMIPEDSRVPWDVAKRNNLQNVRFVPVIGFSDGDMFKEHGVRVEMSLMRFLRDYSGAGYVMYNIIGNAEQWVRFKNDEHYTCLVQFPTENPQFIPLSEDTATVDPTALSTRVQPVLIDGHYPVGVYTFERTPAVVKELCQRVEDNSDNTEIWKAIPLAVQQAVENGEESVLIGFKSETVKGMWKKLLFYGFPPAVALQEARNKRSRESWDDPAKETALFDLVAIHGSGNLTYEYTAEGKRHIPGKYGAFDRMVDEVISQDPNHVLFHHTACSLVNHWNKNRMKPEAREALAKFDATKSRSKALKDLVLEAVKATATIGQWGNKPCIRNNWDAVLQYLAERGFPGLAKSEVSGVWNDNFRPNESIKADVMAFIEQRVANEQRLAKEEAAAFFKPRPAAPPRSPLATISEDANSKRRRID